MKNPLPLALLSTALLATPAFAGMLPATPNSMIVAQSSPVPEGVARSMGTLLVPVQIVHITVRHNGDREIRLVANGLIEARDGEPSQWRGETVQRYLRAPITPRYGVEHYTVSTDEVRVGETVTVNWDSVAHVAHVSVRTHGMKRSAPLDTDVPTRPLQDNPGVDRLAPTGPVIVGVQDSPSRPDSDRREIDAFFVGGPGGRDVDEVKVWDAVRHAYATIGEPDLDRSTDH